MLFYCGFSSLVLILIELPDFASASFFLFLKSRYNCFGLGVSPHFSIRIEIDLLNSNNTSWVYKAIWILSGPLADGKQWQTENALLQHFHVDEVSTQAVCIRIGFYNPIKHISNYLADKYFRTKPDNFIPLQSLIDSINLMNI